MNRVPMFVDVAKRWKLTDRRTYNDRPIHEATFKTRHGLTVLVRTVIGTDRHDVAVRHGQTALAWPEGLRVRSDLRPDQVTAALSDAWDMPRPPRLRRVRPDVYDQWANQTMDWSRNAQGNKKHDGKVAKSYGMFIGLITPDATGRDVYLIVPDGCSTSTTNRHIRECDHAVPHGETVHRVPNIGGAYRSDALDHDKNVRWLIGKADDALGKAGRARAYGTYHLDQAEDYMGQARDYAASFGLALVYPARLTADALDQLRPDMEAKLARHQARQDEREAARQARWRRQDELRAQRQAEYDRQQVERRAQAEVRLADDLARWQDGGPHASNSFFLLSERKDDRLRIGRNGTEVQTTRQCSVPMTAVREALPMVVRAIRNGTTWTGSVRIGAYDLRAITHEHVHVGCHTFTHAEILRFAQSLEDHDRAVSDAQVVAAGMAS